MKRTNIRKSIPTIILVIAVLVAFLCQFISGSTTSRIIRLVIYLSIYIIWGISAQRRIIEPGIKRLFGCISFLMVFWMSLRTVKIILNANYLEHYLWYIYYIPMIFTPFLIAVIALLVRRDENYRLPKWINVFSLIGIAIVVLVLTNDYHQLMFVFPEGKPFSSFDYSYGIGYALPAVWRAGCIITALIILFKRCKLPNKKNRIIAPIIPLIMLIMYYAIYPFDIPIFSRFFVDLSVVECMLSICMLELCMKTGLIQSNTQYTELFSNSTINAHITDGEFNIILSTNSAKELSKEVLESAVNTPVILDGGLRLSSSPINNGYVMWCDDVSDVIKTVNELNRVNQLLTVKRERVQDEYSIARKEHQTKEQKKLYRQVLENTENEIKLYAQLADKIATEENPDEIKRLSCHIAVICAYIKRRISLVFSVEDSSEISSEQLGICICKDSLPCITRCGAQCDYSSEYDGKMTFDELISLYEIFNKVTMYSLDTLKTLSVKLKEKNGFAVMLLEIACDDDLFSFADDRVRVDFSHGKYLLTVGGACYE